MARRAAWIALAAAAGIGLAAALGAARAAGEERWRPEDASGETLDRFLFFATLEGLAEDAMPDEAVKAVLEKDAEGNHRNFVYGCPVCTPVAEGFRAFAMRRDFLFSRKMWDPLTGRPDPALGGEARPSPVARLAARLAGEDRKARGAALHEFVSRCTERRLARLRHTPEQVEGWRRIFEEGRKKGMSVLEASKGFDMKSCPSCDGTCGLGDAWK
jgi:hypothetical protein